jgi:hypothetical protein
VILAPVPVVGEGRAMIENVKTYFVQVILKKLANTGIQQAITAVTVYLVAHQNYLTQFGITTFTWGGWPYPNNPPSGLVTMIEWDTLGVGGATALMVGAGVIYAWFQHHAVAAVTSAPQSGDKRDETSPTIAGGKRKEDPLLPPT